MQSHELNNYITNPNFVLKDSVFFKNIFEMVNHMAEQINQKLPDAANKIECYKHLSLAIYYLAQGLREQPTANSNTFVTR